MRFQIEEKLHSLGVLRKLLYHILQKRAFCGLLHTQLVYMQLGVFFAYKCFAACRFRALIFLKVLKFREKEKHSS